MSVSSIESAFPASEWVPGQRKSRDAFDHFEGESDETGNPRGQEFNWWTDYLELRASGWEWRRAVYIAWASSPIADRQPATQEMLATMVLGLTSDRTIRKWRQQDATIDDAIALAQAAPLLKHRRDIYEALVKSATTPDPRNYSDRRLALEMLGDYVPNRKIEAEVSTVEMSLEDWQAHRAANRQQAAEVAAMFDDDDEEFEDEPASETE